MSSPSFSLNQNPAAFAVRGERTLDPVSAEAAAEFHAHLATFKQAVSHLFDNEELRELCRSKCSGSPKELSDQAWRLARIVENECVTIRSFQSRNGEEISKRAFLDTFLTGCELLARGVWGHSNDKDLVGESFSMLYATVRNCATVSAQRSSEIVKALPIDPKEVRIEQVRKRLDERRARSEARAEAEAERLEDPSQDLERIYNTLDSVRGTPDPALQARQEFQAREVQTWVNVARQDAVPRAPRWLTPVAMAGMPLTGLAIGIGMRHLGIDGDTISNVLVVLGTQLLALAGTLKLTRRWAKPANTIRTPKVPEERTTPNHGSYVSNDRHFEQRMGVTSARVMIPPLGGSIPLRSWLDLLAKNHPGACDVPRHDDFFRTKAVPALAEAAPLGQGETLITLPLDDYKHGFPLSPLYEVFEASLLERSGNTIPFTLAIEEGVLGSFTICGQVPHSASQIQFKVRPRESSSFDADSLQRIKKYLPQQFEAGTSDQVEARRALRTLYQEDGERAAYWIEQLRGRGYRSCDNPELNAVFERFGRFWNTAFHGHRTGNCDFLCAHATSELLTIGTAAFSVAGITPDSSHKTFYTSATHAQSLVLTAAGPRSFDLTIGAKRHLRLDPSRLTEEQRTLAFAQDIAATPNEAYTRGVLLGRAMVPATSTDPAPSLGHRFRDDSKAGAPKEHRQALAYVSAILDFKEHLATLESNDYRGLGEYLSSDEALERLYRIVEGDDSKLPAELRPSLWPHPRTLALAAAKAALVSPTLDAAEKSKVISFLVLRSHESTSEESILPEEVEKLVEQLKQTGTFGTIDTLIEAAKKAGIDPTNLPKLYPALYSAPDLLEALPSDLLQAPGVVASKDLLAISQIVAGHLQKVLLTGIQNAGRFECLPTDTPLSAFEIGSPLALRQGDETLGALRYLEHAIEEFERRKDTAAKQSVPSIYNLALIIVCVNSMMTMKLQGSRNSAQNTKAAELQAAVDQSTRRILDCACACISAPPGSGGLLAALFAGPAGMGSNLPHLLIDDYFSRHGTPLGGRLSEIEAVVGRSVDVYLKGLLADVPGGKMERWLQLLERGAGPIRFERPPVEAATLASSLMGLRELGIGTAMPNCPANQILREHCSNVGARAIEAIESLDRRGFFGPPGSMAAMFSGANEHQAARNLAKAVSIIMHDGKPCLAIEGTHSNLTTTNVLRIPQLTTEIFDPEGRSAGYVRASQIIGGIDARAEAAFREFSKLHPHSSGVLINRLREQIQESGLDPRESSGFSIFDAELFHEDTGAFLSMQEESRDRLGGIPSAIAENAFQGIPPSERHAAFRWLLGVKIARGLSHNSFADEAEAFVALLRDSKIDGRDNPSVDSSIQKTLSECGFEIPETLEGLGMPLSPQAKAAALLTYALFAEEFRQGDSKNFMTLSSLLAVSLMTFEALTRETKKTSEPVHVQVLKHTLSHGFRASCIDRADVTNSFGRLPRNYQQANGNACRVYPEFSDVVVKGMRSPPGESGVYESTRAYSPGMSLRLVDWKASARADKLLVRDHIEELERPTVLVLDLESLMEAACDKMRRVSRGERVRTPPSLTSVLLQLVESDGFRAQCAIVLTAGDVPISVLMSPDSRLRRYLQSSPATATVCKIVQSFTSKDALREVGEKMMLYTLSREADLLTPGVWESAIPPLAVNWLNGMPRGVCFRIFASRERLKQSSEALNRLRQRLARRHGQVEMVQMRTSLPARPNLHGFTA